MSGIPGAGFESSILSVLSRIGALEKRIAQLEGRDFESVLDSQVLSADMSSLLPAGQAGPVNGINLLTPQDHEKVQRLNSYMESRNFNSGLASHAATFIAAAERYGMDWRLGAVLATVESSGGRECFRQFNPFGILGHDFNSWEDAIYAVNRIVSGYGFGNDFHKILNKYNPGGGEIYRNNVLAEMSRI